MTSKTPNPEAIRPRDKTGKPLGKWISGGWECSGADLLAMVPRPRDWGPWRLDPGACVLDAPFPYCYEVDLEGCLTSAAVLNRIAQVAGKTWADAEVIAGLVHALNDVLHPQANLCSWGISSKISPAKARDLIRSAAQLRAEQFRVYPELAGDGGAP